MKTRSFPTPCAILAAVALLSGSAAAAMTTLYELADDATTTQASGTLNSDYYDFLTPVNANSYQGIYEVSMWESDDEPCKMQLRTRHLNTYAGKAATWSECTDDAGAKKTITFSNSETYVRGVSVCLNNGGDRIKGLRLYGTKLDRATGDLDHLAGFKGWARPNCNDNWQTIRYCPAGKIASSITIIQKNSGEASGLRLVCRSVGPG
jgi:hypothetical protein